jgi:hypothetical protein
MHNKIPTLQPDYQNTGQKLPKNPPYDSAAYTDMPILLQREGRPAFPRRSAKPTKKQR